MTSSKDIAETTPEKTSFLDKELSDKQQVVFTILILAVIAVGFFVGVLISGKTTLDAQGFDSTDELISGYIDAFYNKDSAKLKRCYDLYSKDAFVLHKNMSTRATENYHKTTIYPDKIEINTIEYDNIDDVRRNTMLDSISAANISQVTFEMDQVIDGMTYTQLCSQKFITYERNKKWYLYAFEDTSATTLKIVNKDGNQLDIQSGVLDMTDVQIVGTGETGYISVGSDWTCQETTPDEKTRQLTCVSPTGNAQISMMSTDMYESSDDYAVLFLDELSNNDDYKDSLTQKAVSLNGCDATLINATNSATGNTLSIWIFDAPEHDLNAHCITFECLPSEQYAINYISTFKLQ